MIDWRKIAADNNLSTEEFAKEMFTVAACLAAMSLDRDEDKECLKFTCSDDKGPLELYVRRLDSDIEGMK